MPSGSCAEVNKDAGAQVVERVASKLATIG